MTCAPTKQLVGFNDEILDVQFTPDAQHIVLASNSEQVRLFNAEDFSCEALSGRFFLFYFFQGGCASHAWATDSTWHRRR